MFDKSYIIEKAEKFDYEINKEVYENQAGLKDTMNTADIFKKYSVLFSKENISGIKKERSKKDLSEESIRELRYLTRFLI